MTDVEEGGLLSQPVELILPTASKSSKDGSEGCHRDLAVGEADRWWGDGSSSSGSSLAREGHGEGCIEAQLELLSAHHCFELGAGL